MALFILRKLILQTRMHSHPVGLDTYLIFCRTLRLLFMRGCPGSPEPSLVAYVISTIISWARFFVVAKILQTVSVSWLLGRPLELNHILYTCFCGLYYYLLHHKSFKIRKWKTFWWIGFSHYMSFTEIFLLSFASIFQFQKTNGFLMAVLSYISAFEIYFAFSFCSYTTEY